jgi:Trk K+ transport system NAD-binding subunit
MTTVGYGDITPKLDDRTEVLAAMLIMAVGVLFTGIFTAILTARLTQAQWVAVQGLRRIKRRGHVIVCGAGNVGSRVIEYLLALGQRVVVIEANPKPSIVELSRDRHFDLLTGDATDDTTLELCNLGQAEALIALTNSDAMNLEVALGARARNPEMTIVIRVQEASFEESVRRHFGMTRTYATAALAAPVLAGLARFPGARGRIEIAGRDYSIAELNQGADIVMPGVPNCIPLCVWRDGALEYISEFAEVRPRDQVLFLVPVWQLRKDAAE